MSTCILSMHGVYSSPITGHVVCSTMDISTVAVTSDGSGIGVALGMSVVSDGSVWWDFQLINGPRLSHFVGVKSQFCGCLQA